MDIAQILTAVGGAVAGVVISLVFSRKESPEAELEKLERATEEAADEARREAESIARDELRAFTEKAESEADVRREEHRKRDERLRKREATLEERNSTLTAHEKKINRREKDLSRRERKIASREETYEQVIVESKERLETVAALTREEARALLIEEVEEDARLASVDRIRVIEKEAAELAEERARKIVSAAIQRYASEHVGDRTVTAVQLDSEAMKGRIIGREGRNIRAFESTSGCDVVIDESPDTVMISCFNPVRREIGKLAMERLLADGRIHPSRIEEIVARTSKEVEQVSRRRGEEVALDLEISGLHPELIKLLGRLHYVTGFAHNVLKHSIEVAILAGLMADELGVNRKQAVRAGLLHDIGKAAPHEHEGDTAAVASHLCRKYGESKAIFHAVGVVSSPNNQTTILAQLLSASKTLSESRPGAKREALAGFVKRLEHMEELVGEFDGVQKCHAIQAGSEIRVMVDNARLSDRDADLLSRKIAKRIGQDTADAGEIKVTVVRSVRAVQYAR